MALATRPGLGPAADRRPVSRLTAAFEGHPRALTLGVEEELMLLHPGTHDLMARAPELVAQLDDRRFRTELPAAQVELVTPVCRDAGHVLRCLRAGRRALLAGAGGSARLAGAGTHPCAPAEGAISPGERYERIAHQYQWAARRGLAWGLHVHVAIPGADRALAVHDAVREWLPVIAALAGNAPFHEGRDTGLHSVRPKLAEGFPRQGVPPAWHSWDAYLDFLRWGAAPGITEAEAARDLWWEVRLHLVHGTIEVRVCDQPATARESAALAAVIQALCGTLACAYDAGELGAPLDRERIEENRWRALRHGLDATVLGYGGPGERPIRDVVAELLRSLAPVAEACGSTAQLADAWELLEETGSSRQRLVAARDGVPGVAPWLADRFEAELRPPR